MDTITAIREMMQAKGLSVRGVGVVLGKSQTYINGIIYRGSVPKADTLSAIADACDYDLLLRDRAEGTEIIIDPPNRD